MTAGLFLFLKRIENPVGVMKPIRVIDLMRVIDLIRVIRLISEIRVKRTRNLNPGDKEPLRALRLCANPNGNTTNPEPGTCVRTAGEDT